MCASFDRLPLDYTLGEMRSGADRGVAVEAAILRVCVSLLPAEPRARQNLMLCLCHSLEFECVHCGVRLWFFCSPRVLCLVKRLRTVLYGFGRARLRL